MKRVLDIGTQPAQVFQLILPSGKTMDLTLVFSRQQLGWYMSVEYDDFVVNNVKVVNSLNILNPWKNIIPFGFACATDDNYEPQFLEDFDSGRAALFILDEDDLDEVEELYAE